LKIVFLVKRFYTNKDLVADCFGRLYHFPVTLAAMGHECVVYALDFRNTTELQVRKDGVLFQTLPVKSFWRLPLLRRLWRELTTTHADVVFSSGDSYCGYLGLQLAHRLGAKAVFDIYDDYAHFGSNRIPGMRALLRKAVSGSDLVLCASEPIQQSYGAWQDNTLLSQNGVDTTVFQPQDMQRARASCAIAAGDIVVGYFGSIHKLRGADDLIAAVALLRARGQPIKLLLAGRDYGDVSLDEPWIDYRGMLPQAQVVALINACNVVTIPYKDTDIIRMTNACKLMEYIACKVPIVVTDVSDYASYFADHPDCVARASDPESLAAALTKQIANRHLVDTGAVLSWNRLAAELEQRLLQLLPA